MEIYSQPWAWNAMHWGNVGFVYAGAAMRLAFLSGVGLNTQSAQEAARVAATRKSKSK